MLFLEKKGRKMLSMMGVSGFLLLAIIVIGIFLIYRIYKN